ncbi:MAG: ATP-binding protein [Candidatus Izemoplasmatales bacterium]|nr:ATP-binding protein [Candidatus Izemoplasmatales bacterium]
MKKILILSGKGGTGKTTVASNFINISKARVFSDCDVEAPNLHLVSMLSNVQNRENYYGLDKSVINQDKCIQCGICQSYCRFNAISFVNGTYLIDPHMCEGCGVCNYVCPEKAIDFVKSVDGETMLYKEDKVFSTATLKMGSGNSGLLVTKVKKQMQDYIKDDDLVIIDGPPGIGCPVIASMSGVDLILLVAEPSVSGISDLQRIIKTAASFHLKTAVCINKFDLNKKLSHDIISYLKANDIDYAGEIGYHQEIIDSINKGETLPINTQAYKDIKKIYDFTVNLLA